MKIDEDAIRAGAVAMGRAGANQFDLHTRMAMARAAVTAYLAALPALPAAEPGRDRIAVVVNASGLAAIGDGRLMTEDNWRALEDEVSVGPFARAIIEVNLPRPNETPVVSGSVLRVL